MENSTFLFDGEFFKQLIGGAMGSSVVAIVADLFMGHFEVKMLASWHGLAPDFCKRYVDDTLSLTYQEFRVQGFH